MNPRRLLWLALCVPLAACAISTRVTSSGSTLSTAQAPATPSPTAIVLHRAPANLGCDAIGVDYRSVTFHIDPTAAEQVSAVADTGALLATFWADGFRGGPIAERAIRDPAGQVVVADGDVLAIPQAAWPRLRGYFVCPAASALYVLLVDPS